ncbi:18S rRNA pseudouridine methyltransferase [Mortierella alpina]|nr:18S rRNA pseudouridine methyltransferase [Mortierella alpina]
MPMDADGAVDKNALSSTLAHLNKMSLRVFSSFSPSVDPLDLTTRVLYLSGDESIGELKQAVVLQSIIGHRFNTSSSSRNSSTEFVYSDPNRWLSLADHAAEFMQKLLAISQTDRDNAYYSESIEEIADMTPPINWTLFIETTYPPDFGYTPPIIVASPQYQRNLETILSSAKPIELQSYFIWEILRQLPPLIYPQDQPLRITSGDSSLSLVRSMGESIRAAFNESFGKSLWIDESTRNEAINKLNQTLILVGSNPKFHSSISLHRRYINLTIVPDDFLGNRLRYRIWRLETLFRRLSKNVERDAFSFSFNSLHPGSMRRKKNVEIPAAMIQPPLFHLDYPDYINFGGMGALIARELTYHFDRFGHLFDEAGDEVNRWSNASMINFYRRALCFVDQYGNYTIKGLNNTDLHIDGAATFDENLADNEGARLAFQAWRFRHQLSHGNIPSNNAFLPGFQNYTLEQMYFLSYAQTWCQKQDAQFLEWQISSDIHSPNKWRVNGVLRNSVEFATAFKCKQDSIMNPPNKCGMWVVENEWGENGEEGRNTEK